MKIKTLMIIMLAYGILFYGIFTYLKSSQLQEPLLLTHYYEKEYFQSKIDYIPLYYITNQDDHFQLVSVESEALPGQMIFVEHDSITGREGIYKQHEAIISIDGLQEEVILDKLIFHFSNGTAIQGDIGSIKLIPMKSPDPEDLVVNFSTSGSSNTGESYTVGGVKRDGGLTEIALPFPEMVDPVLKLGVEKMSRNYSRGNHEQLLSSNEKQSAADIALPIKAARGEMIKVNAVVDKSLMYKSNIHAIEADIRGVFQTEDEKIEQSLIRISEKPYLTSKQIKELKKLREEGDQ
ncbi:hypothetical protein FZC78_15590 [Rossellomorea vietnamensis]|uniref:Uncharacterized protein n=1 Tax=Rossellomorea vietnamensis TaxID=218284 RepID=A0A5D4NRF1_9BACI|nr:hypothetical protein [Rossellomorea vietnamensis]TYS15422.1 hypothetical protein FZC78_15590 [Rossellomorea vietnamensis]